MKERLSTSVAALVAINLLPLIGVLFFDWSVYEILVLFWAENLVIGLYTITRLVTLYRRKGEEAALFMVFFFCFHFGGFTMGHGLFVIFGLSEFFPGDPISDVGIPWAY